MAGTSSFLVIAVVLCAVAITAQARGDKKGNTLVLQDQKLIKTTGDDKTAKLGDTATLQYTYEGGAVSIYQTGIYVDLSGGKLVNYQLTVTLRKKIGHFDAGKIFLVGDGTGVQDPATLPKAVVGGTGPYAGATGTYKVKNKKVYITLFPSSH